MEFEHIHTIPVVYIAGPYRSASRLIIARNIREAEEWGNTVAELGAFPFIPHANTAFLEGAFPDQFFLDGDLAVLYKSDAALFIPKWETSAGAVREWDFATYHGIPCFEAVTTKELDRLATWIGEFQAGRLSTAESAKNADGARKGDYEQHTGL